MGEPASWTTVTVATMDGQPVACGVMHGLSSTRARLSTDNPLPVGATLRFRILARDPPDVIEPDGVVLWTESLVNAAGSHIAVSEVKWHNGDTCAASAPRQALGQREEDASGSPPSMEDRS